MDTRLDLADLTQIDGFMRDIAEQMGWDEASAQRLRSAGEETLSSLLQPANEYKADEATGRTPRLLVVARPDGRAVELEFVSVLEDEQNLGDRLAYLDDEEESVDDREVSFRLLRHYASSVRHHKYYGMDVVMVRVEA